MSMIVKRDGALVPFDRMKIKEAIVKCFVASGESGGDGMSADARANYLAEDVTERVLSSAERRCVYATVEDVQDEVEQTLQRCGFYRQAKLYILYRAQHAEARASTRTIPDDVRAAYAADDQYFPTQLQKFQFLDKYSRFNAELGRRETWVETVDRAVDYLHELGGDRLDSIVYQEIRRAILEMRVLPSMRLLAMAGAPARRNPILIYNCSYLPVDAWESFSEALYISMSGCGVGFSVEREYVEKLPPIKPRNRTSPRRFVVDDSAEGWVDALRTGLYAWADGNEIRFDLSQIRPAGTVLRTKGGRASGPEPLRQLLEYARTTLCGGPHLSMRTEDRHLTSLEAHDLMCASGYAAVSGGVRRTAMISLFDDDDTAMRECKDGDFDRLHPERWNANNSAVWTDHPSDGLRFMREFGHMLKMGRGEPGIFSRQVAQETVPSRRAKVDFGTNPCGEIVLRPYQFCNLSAAVARADDDYHALAEKVRIATTIGCIQSLATNFPVLRPMWQANGELERLIGVDITGQRDCVKLQDWGRPILQGLQAVVKSEALQSSRALGINFPASLTCVKPSGNTSQLVDCSSGLHARWAPYYVRNVRVSATSPLYQVLKSAGAPLAPENGQDAQSANTWVVSFPVKSPDGAICRADLSAIDQCKYWLKMKHGWTEHNPSVTITYRPDEVVELTAWVWKHRTSLGGMAFLPASDAKYDKLPYIEIDQAEYERRVAEFPAIDFAQIWVYENEDHTTAAQELACSAGICEL